MLHSDIKSRPVHQPLVPDLAGGRHLLVVEGETLVPGRLEALVGVFAPVQASLHTWLAGAAAPMSGLGRLWQLESAADVVDALACASRGYGVGDRLYVQGTEPFLWAVATAAAVIGFGEKQVQLQQAGSLRHHLGTALTAIVGLGPSSITTKTGGTAARYPKTHRGPQT